MTCIAYTMEVEQALCNNPIPIHEQNVHGELRYIYYCETDSGRLLAVVLIERGELIRVVIAYVSMLARGETIFPGESAGSNR